MARAGFYQTTVINVVRKKNRRTEEQRNNLGRTRVFFLILCREQIQTGKHGPLRW